MKNVIITAIALITTISINAQTDTTMKFNMPGKFFDAMQKQVSMLDTAKTMATLQQVYNSLDRIAGAEKKQWLPDYYMAYCLVLESYMDDTKKVDDYCDQADQLLVRADSISPKNSEILVLRSMCTSARIRVNPMTRGSKYGKKSGEFLQQAQQLDSTNPRIPYLHGTGLLYTPPAFGGGKDKAKPVLEDAVKKFDAFKPASPIHPHWGKDQAQKMLDQCNKQ